MATLPDGTQKVAATAWVATGLGAPTAVLQTREVDVGPPGPNQVRVAGETFCLDFNDIDTIRGRYGLLKMEPPFVPGMVTAGTVDAAGPGCRSASRPAGCGCHGRSAGRIRLGCTSRCGVRADAAELAQFR